MLDIYQLRRQICDMERIIAEQKLIIEQQNIDLSKLRDKITEQNLNIALQQNQIDDLNLIIEDYETEDYKI